MVAVRGWHRSFARAFSSWGTVLPTSFLQCIPWLSSAPFPGSPHCQGLALTSEPCCCVPTTVSCSLLLSSGAPSSSSSQTFPHPACCLWHIPKELLRAAAPVPWEAPPLPLLDSTDEIHLGSQSAQQLSCIAHTHYPLLSCINSSLKDLGAPTCDNVTHHTGQNSTAALRNCTVLHRLSTFAKQSTGLVIWKGFKDLHLAL